MRIFRPSAAAAFALALLLSPLAAADRPRPGGTPDVVDDPFARGTGVIPDRRSNGAEHPGLDADRQRELRRPAPRVETPPVENPVGPGRFPAYDRRSPYGGALGR
jgi:hypothetical protein